MKMWSLHQTLSKPSNLCVCVCAYMCACVCVCVQLHADWLHVSEAHHETLLDADLGHVEGDALCGSGHHAGGAVSVDDVISVRQCSSRRSRVFLQTPEVQNLLQTAEEPEQRGEEPGVAGRSPWQRLPRAAAAHAASGGRPVIGSAAGGGAILSS